MTEDNVTGDNVERMDREQGQIEDACILRYAVETNGYHLGNAGHGGYLMLIFTNDSGVDMAAAINTSSPDPEELTDIDMNKSVVIKMSGDAEIRTMSFALRKIADFLEKIL